MTLGRLSHPCRRSCRRRSIRPTEANSNLVSAGEVAMTAVVARTMLDEGGFRVGPNHHDIQHPA
jgi:hypothetical protein